MARMQTTTQRAAPFRDHALALGAGVLLIAAILLSFLPGQAGVPPVDRDEPRYTQATKQMLETGDYVRIRFQEDPRHKKPIGIHWLQALSAKVSGLGADAPLWVYRIPSLFGAMAAVLLTLWAARAFLPPPLALTAAVLFGATIILGVEARLAKTDAVLLATILAAQGALARLWLAENRPLGLAALFWVALALGILVKGPIAPMVAGLTIVTLLVVDRRRLLGNLRIPIGIVIVATVCLPWYVAIYLATDGAFYAAAIGKDFLGKAAGGQEGHGAPPLVHLAFFLGVGWPMAAFAVAALWRIVKMRGAVFLFALAWVVPAWIVFELTPTKLPHYTLPVLPGIAIAAVASLSRAAPPRWLAIVAGVMILSAPLAILVAAPILVSALSGMAPESADLLTRWRVLAAFALVALSLAAALTAAIRVWRGRAMVSAAVVGPAVAAAVIAQAAVWGLALPSFEPVWISTRLVAAADAAAPCANPRLVSVGGYNEPSMIFLAGTETALATPDEAVAIAKAAECAVIAVRDEAMVPFRAAAGEADLALDEAGTVEGFNISKGDPIHLTLLVPATP